MKIGDDGYDDEHYYRIVTSKTNRKIGMKAWHEANEILRKRFENK